MAVDTTTITPSLYDQTKGSGDGVSNDMQQDMVGCEKQINFYIAMIDIMDPNTKYIVKHVHYNVA